MYTVNHLMVAYGWRFSSIVNMYGVAKHSMIAYDWRKSLYCVQLRVRVLRFLSPLWVGLRCPPLDTNEVPTKSKNRIVCKSSPFKATGAHASHTAG